MLQNNGFTYRHGWSSDPPFSHGYPEFHSEDHKDVVWYLRTDDARIEHNLQCIQTEMEKKERYYPAMFSLDNGFFDTPSTSIAVVGFNKPIDRLFPNQSNGELTSNDIGKQLYGKSLDTIKYTTIQIWNVWMIDWYKFSEAKIENIRDKFIDVLSQFHNEISDVALYSFATMNPSKFANLNVTDNFKISRLSWLNIFSKKAVEIIGQEPLLSSPAWMVKSLDDGSIIVIISSDQSEEDDYVCDEQHTYIHKPARTSVEHHLGIKNDVKSRKHYKEG